MPPTNPAELRELSERAETAEWAVQWFIRQAKDESLTPEERLSIIANFPASPSPPSVDRERVEKLAEREESFAALCREQAGLADGMGVDRTADTIRKDAAEALANATALRNLLAQHVPTGGAGWRPIDEVTSRKSDESVLAYWAWELPGEKYAVTSAEDALASDATHFMALPQPPQENPEWELTRTIFDAMPRHGACDPGCTITPGEWPDCGCWMEAEIIRQAVAQHTRLSALTPPDETEWAAVIDECIEVERADEMHDGQMVRINIIKGSLEAARTLIGMAGGVK